VRLRLAVGLWLSRGVVRLDVDVELAGVGICCADHGEDVHGQGVVVMGSDADGVDMVEKLPAVVLRIAKKPPVSPAAEGDDGAAGVEGVDCFDKCCVVPEDRGGKRLGCVLGDVTSDCSGVADVLNLDGLAVTGRGKPSSGKVLKVDVVPVKHAVEVRVPRVSVRGVGQFEKRYASPDSLSPEGALT